MKKSMKNVKVLGKCQRINVKNIYLEQNTQVVSGEWNESK